MKEILLIIANGLIRLAAALTLPGNKGRIPPDAVRRILVYGQMGIGNMILFTPFLKALRQQFPEAVINVLLLTRNGAEQVLEGSRLVNEILIWNYRELGYRQRYDAIMKLKNSRPDLIVSRFSSQPIDLALVMLLSRAPYRVGHVSSGGWQGKYDYLYNYPVKMTENEHEIDRYLRLAAEIGVSGAPGETSFPVSRDDERKAAKFLDRHGIKDNEALVTIQMGTSPAQSWKRWDVEKWAALTETILQTGVKVVALGSADEKSFINAAFAATALQPVNAAGELTLKETAAVIKRSDLLVCQDSGLMHVAAAVSTPTVAIFGPTDYTRTAPAGTNHLIIRKNLDCSPCLTMKGTAVAEACRNRVCLDSIEVGEVLEAVRRQLKAAAKRQPHSVGGKKA